MDSLPNLQRFSTSYRQFIYAHHHNVLTEEDLQEYFPDEALFDTLANYRHHVSCLRGCHPDVRPFDQIFLDIAPLPLLVDCYFEYDKGYDIAPLWMSCTFELQLDKDPRMVFKSALSTAKVLVTAGRQNWH